MTSKRAVTIEDLNRLEDKVDAVLDKLDRKFSAKWVEWFVKAQISAVLLAVLTVAAEFVAKVQAFRGK